MRLYKRRLVSVALMVGLGSVAGGEVSEVNRDADSTLVFDPADQEALQLLEQLEQRVRSSPAAVREEAQALADRVVSPAVRSAAELIVGLGYQSQGDSKEALAASDRAASFAEVAGDELLVGRARLLEAAALLSLARVEEAVGPLQRARELLEQHGTPYHLSSLYNTIGVLHHTRFDMNQALSNYRAALDQALLAGDKIEQSRAHYNIGTIMWNVGDLEAASSSIETAQRLRLSVESTPPGFLPSRSGSLGRRAR